MSNVIVTGGTGFLGRNMIRCLCAQGYTVYAVVRPESKNRSMLPQHQNVVPVVCSLRNLVHCEQLQSGNYGAFFHFAWGGVNRDEIDDEDVQRRSLEESLEAVKAAIALKCDCFLFAGSRSEYGFLRGEFQEESECHPQVAYGRAKLEFGQQARRLCENSCTRYLHARIFSVYGPDDHPWSLISTAVRKMRKNEPMDLSACTHLWNFMDVRDMADLLLTCYRMHQTIPKEDSGIFNVATRDIRPLREYIEEIYSITGSTSELRFGAFRPGAESSISLQPDMSKVESQLGWKPKIAFSDGIRDMVQQLEGEDA